MPIMLQPQTTNKYWYKKRWLHVFMFKTVLGVYTQNKNVYCMVGIYLEKQKIKISFGLC